MACFWPFLCAWQCTSYPKIILYQDIILPEDKRNCAPKQTKRSTRSYLSLPVFAIKIWWRCQSTLALLTELTSLWGRLIIKNVYLIILPFSIIFLPEIKFKNVIRIFGQSFQILVKALSSLGLSQRPRLNHCKSEA